MKPSTYKRGMRGFSLMEVLIVTSITLTVAGVAVPKIITTVADMELRGAAHSAAGLLQQTRMQAVKSDTFLKTKYLNSNGGGFVFADLNDDGVAQSTEPQAQLGNAVLAYSAPTNIPALSTTDLGYSTVTTTAVDFSATGQPCSALHTCGVGMVMYFYDTRNIGTPGWAAVAVTPAGRVQTWMWNGSAWKQA